jgi:apyrase
MRLGYLPRGNGLAKLARRVASIFLRIIPFVFAVKNGALATSNYSEDDINYAVLIDAGSSGSRVHVFEIKNDASLGEIPNLRLPPHKLKIEPGLSSFAGNPQDAGASLEPLVDFAMRKVPARSWRETPIILAATGGVRMLTPDVADLVMRSCLHALRATPFKVMPAERTPGGEPSAS